MSNRIEVMDAPRWPEHVRPVANHQLILDYSSLKLLAQPIPDKYISFGAGYHAHTYLDLLRYLPCDVVIPDITIYRVTGQAVTRGDKGLNWRPVEAQSDHENERSLAAIRDFVEGKEPGATVQFYPKTQAYFPELEAQIQKTAAVLERENGRSDFASQERVKAAKLALHRAYEKGNQLSGSAAVRAALQHATNYDSLATVLTEELRTIKTTAASLGNATHADEMAIAPLNIQGLLEALQTQGILKEAGLRNGLRLSAVVQDMRVNSRYRLMDQSLVDVPVDGLEERPHQSFASKLQHERRTENNARSSRMY